MGCHNQGIRQATDEIRQHVLNDRTFSKDVRIQVEALYPEQVEFKSVLDQDADHFRGAMQRAGLDPELDSQKVGVESINFLSKAYEKAIDLRLAAAEYGLAVEAFARGLKEAGAESGQPQARAGRAAAGDPRRLPRVRRPKKRAPRPSQTSPRARRSRSR
jgi:hypothetical protein